MAFWNRHDTEESDLARTHAEAMALAEEMKLERMRAMAYSAGSVLPRSTKIVELERENHYLKDQLSKYEGLRPIRSSTEEQVDEAEESVIDKVSIRISKDEIRRVVRVQLVGYTPKGNKKGIEMVSDHHLRGDIEIEFPQIFVGLK